MINFNRYLEKGFFEFIDKFSNEQLTIVQQNELFKIIEDYSKFKYSYKILLEKINKINFYDWVKEEVLLEININIIKKLTIDITDKYIYNDIELYYLQEKLEEKYTKKVIYNNINMDYLKKFEKKHFDSLHKIVNIYKKEFRFSDEVEYDSKEQNIFCIITDKESYTLFLKLKKDIDIIKKLTTNELFQYIENNKILKTLEEQFQNIEDPDLEEDFLYL